MNLGPHDFTDEWYRCSICGVQYDWIRKHGPEQCNRTGHKLDVPMESCEFCYCSVDEIARSDTKILTDCRDRRKDLKTWNQYVGGLKARHG